MHPVRSSSAAVIALEDWEFFLVMDPPLRHLLLEDGDKMMNKIKSEIFAYFGHSAH